MGNDPRPLNQQATPLVQNCQSGETPGPQALGPQDEMAAMSLSPAEHGRWELWYNKRLIGHTNRIITVDESTGAKLPEETAGFFDEMRFAAAQDGITLGLKDGWRTIGAQKYYYKGWTAKQAAKADGSFQSRQNEIISYFDPEENRHYSGKLKGFNPAASPGRSNHHWGGAVDIKAGTWRDTGGHVYQWLVYNAHKYGWVRTVWNERWHWEYWGNWAGEQARPEWAKGWHTPATMFQYVPADHTLYDGGGSTKSPITTGRWGDHSDNPLGANHPDNASKGKTNTWIGYDGRNLAEDVLSHRSDMAIWEDGRVYVPSPFQ
tara:strand:- start:23428 stop:24384 length:957 start_codon:yes stop_codon:yes gene_type:complete